MKLLNPVLWVLKIVTGVGLIVLLGLHFYTLHFHSGLLLFPGSIYYWLFVAFLLVHIVTALKDILLEAGLKRTIVAPTLIVLAILIISPPILGVNSLTAIQGELEEPEGDSCVRDADWMRYNHKSLLLDWREEVVRQGERFNQTDGKMEKSLEKKCLDCHNYDNFCSKCHDYAGIDPNCYSCHIKPESGQGQ